MQMIESESCGMSSLVIFFIVTRKRLAELVLLLSIKLYYQYPFI